MSHHIGETGLSSFLYIIFHKQFPIVIVYSILAWSITIPKIYDISLDNPVHAELSLNSHVTKQNSASSMVCH